MRSLVFYVLLRKETAVDYIPASRQQRVKIKHTAVKFSSWSISHKTPQQNTHSCIKRNILFFSSCFIFWRQHRAHTVVARCEVHGTAVKPGMKMKAGEPQQYMTAFALNEWDSKLAGGVEWRQKIDTQVLQLLRVSIRSSHREFCLLILHSFAGEERSML